jgi:hypothetical protein
MKTIIPVAIKMIRKTRIANQPISCAVAQDKAVAKWGFSNVARASA